VTVYSALRKSGAKAGDWVALLGAGGGLGHLACQIARGMGFRVIGIDAGAKKDFAIECGTEVFIGKNLLGIISSKTLANYTQQFLDYEKQNAEEEVKNATGGLGAQAVLVLTAANGAYAMAMNLLRFAGTMVCVGIPEGELKVCFGV
jgi:propanol-preferring alcohol dehydrogenase